MSFLDSTIHNIFTKNVTTYIHSTCPVGRLQHLFLYFLTLKLCCSGDFSVSIANFRMFIINLAKDLHKLISWFSTLEDLTYYYNARTTVEWLRFSVLKWARTCQISQRRWLIKDFLDWRGAGGGGFGSTCILYICLILQIRLKLQNRKTRMKIIASQQVLESHGVSEWVTIVTKKAMYFWHRCWLLQKIFTHTHTHGDETFHIHKNKTITNNFTTSNTSEF